MGLEARGLFPVQFGILLGVVLVKQELSEKKGRSFSFPETRKCIGSASTRETPGGDGEQHGKEQLRVFRCLPAPRKCAPH